MCTAISFLGKNHYFGRNLDLEHHWQEQVVIAPRHFPLIGAEDHYALIGMATVVTGYPLFFEGTNERGLSAAALNFPGNAVYHRPENGKRNIPSYNLISYVLARCGSCREVRQLLADSVITWDAFGEDMPPSPLHWLIADRKEALVVESTAEGLQLYENPVGVLTNNPPFPAQMVSLCNYMSLSPEGPENRIAPGVPLTPYSRGMGAMGLPGDFSSPSRFVRSVFVKYASNPETDGLSQFFHMLSAVEQVDGCVRIGDKFQKTLYSCCCDTEKGIYYYTTYGNRQITAIDMHKTNLDSTSLSTFSLITEQQIRWENGKSGG